MARGPGRGTERQRTRARENRLCFVELFGPDRAVPNHALVREGSCLHSSLPRLTGFWDYCRNKASLVRLQKRGVPAGSGRGAGYRSQKNSTCPRPWAIDPPQLVNTTALWEAFLFPTFPSWGVWNVYRQKSKRSGRVARVVKSTDNPHMQTE